MKYYIKYEIEEVQRDMILEDLFEKASQHILKKYKLCSAKKTIKEAVYKVIIDNNSEPKLQLFDKNYNEIYQN